MFFLTTPQENVSIQSIQQYFNALACGEGDSCREHSGLYEHSSRQGRADVHTFQRAERPGHSASSHSFSNGL